EIQEARCNKAGQLGTVGQVGIAPWRQERKALDVQKDIGKAQQDGGCEAWQCGKEAITYATRDECGEGTYRACDARDEGNRPAGHRCGQWRRRSVEGDRREHRRSRHALITTFTQRFESRRKPALVIWLRARDSALTSNR